MNNKKQIEKWLNEAPKCIILTDVDITSQSTFKKGKLSIGVAEGIIRFLVTGDEENGN